MKLRPTRPSRRTLLPMLIALLAAGGAAGAGAAGGQTSVLSPRVRWAAESATQTRLTGVRTIPGWMETSVLWPGETTGPGFLGATETALRLLVTTDDPEALTRRGFTVGTVAGTVATVAGAVATVTVPVSRLQELGALPGVRAVELSLPVRPLLDVSRAECGADAAHGRDAPPYPTSGATGRGVVVGIIDSGIDYRHEDFRRENGTSRLLSLWDQTDNGGPTPSGYDYGTLWASSALGNNTARERDTNGHGTHTAGIAAGNGRAGIGYGFAGIAPEADLVVVKTIFDDNSIIDAASWIFSVAGSRPCVINLSLGSQFGPHDGSVPMDRALAALSGPGRIFVAAAGNEGEARHHAEVEVPSGGTVSVRFAVADYDRDAIARDDYLSLEGWAPAEAGLSVRVTTPHGIAGASVGINDVNESDTPDGWVRVAQSFYSGNGERQVQIDVWDQTAARPPAPGTWTLELANSGPASAQVDFYIPYQYLGGKDFLAYWRDAFSSLEVVTYPATSDSVVAVASYVTKNSWRGQTGTTWTYSPEAPIGTLSSFSSSGPRRDGVPKPDLAAPGQGIVSVRSSFSQGTFSDPSFVQAGGLYVLNQGTSQASPHVAGAVALILEKHPTSSCREILTRLTQTARADAFTGALPNPRFGHGKLDALAAVTSESLVFLQSLSAAWENGEVVVRWTLGRASPETHFVVERGGARLGPFAAVSGSLAGGTSFAWADPEPDSLATWYRLQAVTSGAGTQIFGPVELRVLAAAPRLWHNAPNPFTASTTVTIELDRPQSVDLRIVDLQGRSVKTLFSGMQAAGRRDVAWDGRDDRGRLAPSGVYFARFATASGIQAQRLVLVR